MARRAERRAPGEAAKSRAGKRGERGRAKPVGTGLSQATPPPGPAALRVGQGFDIHATVPGRPLWLGGVHVPWPRGLAGHSDGDAALHAVCNALLGALGEGDLGRHYPPGDPRFAGARSERFVRGVMAKVRSRGYRVVNVDVTLVAEKPRLAPYLPAMRRCLERLLKVGSGTVNLKAASAEGIGSLGRGRAIAALAVVLLAGASPGRRRLLPRSSQR